MKKRIVVLVAMALNATVTAQVVPAAKETAKGIAESTKQAGDNVMAATSSEPKKSMYKAKAQVHKAKAHAHRHEAKKAADAIVH